MIDVCLVLEATYPYVAGGVSTWVHQLLSQMPNIKFGIVHIAAHVDHSRTIKYQVPDNVMFLQDVYLHDYQLTRREKNKLTVSQVGVIKKFYEAMFAGKLDGFSEFAKIFRDEAQQIDLVEFFQSELVYLTLNEFYQKYAGEESYLDFFWTFRDTHLPILQTLRAQIPRAKIYHAVSTGYAGVLAALAKMERGGKYFLTEHGIYNHERFLEISQSNWIYEKYYRSFRASAHLSLFKRWWVGIFQMMGRIAYQYADQIFTLYEGNKIRQIMEGANPDKVSIIPNGIDLKPYEVLQRAPKKFPTIGLIGRVVNIKDIKTYIHAAKLVVQRIPEAKFYVIGPTDEEEDYDEECRNLVNFLGLEEVVQFTGRKNVMDYYQFLDVVVLTSLSEAQPYIILEANAAGIPVVATDVGACREMLEGRAGEDQHLGSSGMLTEVANPNATAQAILYLLQQREFYQKCVEAGKQRVKLYYDQDDLLASYLNLYEQNL